MAHLSWSKSETLVGDASAKARLRSLILLVTKWYGVIAILIVVGILPIGWIFFSSNTHPSPVNWQVAWTWLVLASAVNVIAMPMLSLLEGCGRVTEIARLRMYQNFLGSTFAWLILLGGGGLLAMPVMSTCFALTVLIWLWRTKRDFFTSLLEEKAESASIKWKTEIWPFQWRIALSWLSGYFIFQLFTPVLFAYRGAVEAGQMGISISVANALMGIAIAWINTKAPGFGSLVAKKDYINLDRLFNLTLSRSLYVMVAIGAMLCAINYIIHAESFEFAYRFLDPLPFLFLMSATIFAYVTYAQAAYLRAHKEEPFMLISLISAALIGGLTVVLAKEYGATGLMAVYATVYAIVGVGWGSIIFTSKRREWQRLPS
jgi:O-antigen/teichoic acid export membrane protein